MDPVLQTASADYLFCARFGPMLPFYGVSFYMNLISVLIVGCGIWFVSCTVRFYCCSSPMIVFFICSCCCESDAEFLDTIGPSTFIVHLVPRLVFLCDLPFSRFCSIKSLSWSLRSVESSCSLIFSSRAAATSCKSDLIWSDASAWFLFGRMSFSCNSEFYFK